MIGFSAFGPTLILYSFRVSPKLAERGAREIRTSTGSAEHAARDAAGFLS